MVTSLDLSPTSAGLLILLYNELHSLVDIASFGVNDVQEVESFIFWCSVRIAINTHTFLLLGNGRIGSIYFSADMHSATYTHN